MSGFVIVPGTEVTRAALNQFLDSVYPPKKSSFISRHGAWLYRGGDNQWAVVADNDEIVGYCAVIPTKCRLDGMVIPAVWWVDLIIDPAYRGRGIQTQIDARIRQVAPLILGFPNELAAKIHRKHGWGVREDGEVLLLPMRPVEVRKVQQSTGKRGILLRLGARGLAPVAAIWRRRLMSFVSQRSRLLTEPDPSSLAIAFERTWQFQPTSTRRDREYITWRSFEAPYRDELAFYSAGDPEAPTHVLIARYQTGRSTRTMRILDLYGDLGDREALEDILRLALRDAARQSVSQVTVMNFLPELSPLFRRLGFIFSAVGRFCWHSADSRIFEAVAGVQHWTLADSDNDEPL